MEERMYFPPDSIWRQKASTRRSRLLEAEDGSGFIRAKRMPAETETGESKKNGLPVPDRMPAEQKTERGCEAGRHQKDGEELGSSKYKKRRVM